MKISRSHVTLAAVLVFSSLSGAARAKEQFPKEIAAHLGAQATPPCGVCHQYAKTGGDTLVTPFAWGMRARGLTGQDTLLPALDRVRADELGGQHARQARPRRGSQARVRRRRRA